MPCETISPRVRCADCGREHDGSPAVCALCGALLAPPRGTSRPRPDAPPSASEEDAVLRDRRRAWLFLGLGLAAAPIFGALPWLGFVGWFLGALVHELGHTIAAWFCGMPSFPAISLAGEAVAVHGEPLPLLLVVLMAALASGLWRVLPDAERHWAVPAALATHAAIALTPAREVLFLLAGHLGELAFGAVFLGRALDGGFHGSNAERFLYSMLGWYWIGSGAKLSLELATSAQARAAYASGGSFGLTNDLLRLSAQLGLPLELVACFVFLLALAAAPCAVLGWRWLEARA